MFTTQWSTSERKYDVVVDRDVKVRMSDGTHLDGNGVVGMFGVSYFARLAKAVAALGPKPLKAIFAPFAGTDDYRHRCYHGGILAHGFISHWRNSLHKPNYRSLYKEQHGEAAYKEAIALALRDEEIVAQSGLREALQNPDAGTNAL